jgi:isocitrate dehydrogenase
MPAKTNVVIFRENTEDIYAGIEFEAGTPEAAEVLEFLKTRFPKQYSKIRFPGSVGLGIKPVSREGTERLVRSAIEYSLRMKRKSLTLVHKGNIMKFTEGSFRTWGYALAEREFGDRVYVGQGAHQEAKGESRRTPSRRPPSPRGRSSSRTPSPTSRSSRC